MICDVDCDHLYYTVALYQLVRNTLQQQALRIKKRQNGFWKASKNEEKNKVCTFRSIPFIAIFLPDRSWWSVSAGDIAYTANITHLHVECVSKLKSRNLSCSLLSLFIWKFLTKLLTYWCDNLIRRAVIFSLNVGSHIFR